MAQWLRALAAHPEDPGSIPASMKGSSQPPVAPAVGDLTLSSGLRGHLYMYAQTGAHIHINKSK